MYLHLPVDARRTAYRNVAAAVAPGGTLLVAGHDTTDLAYGYGGPQVQRVICRSTEPGSGQLSFRVGALTCAVLGPRWVPVWVRPCGRGQR